LTPRFSVNRTVREYTEQRYLPAATAFRERAADKGAIGKQVVDWRQTLEQKWATLHFGEVKVETRGGQHVFDVQVCLNDLDPKAVRVELYADGINGGDPVREEMKSDPSRGCVFHATLPATRPASDYTARAIPHRSGVAVPLESARILWQR
jgi:starch phosphorylase